MQIIQYFVFDKSGNDILEANAFQCSSEQETNDLVDTMKNNFHSDPIFKDTQLLISCGNKVLFNSKAI